MPASVCPTEDRLHAISRGPCGRKTVPDPPHAPVLGVPGGSTCPRPKLGERGASKESVRGLRYSRGSEKIEIPIQ